jgi:hypothetical protein
MRSLTTTELEFTAGGNMGRAGLAGAAIVAGLSILATFVVASLSYKAYHAFKTPNCGWQPYLREQRTPLYDAYGNPTGLDDVLTIEDHQWVCV